VQIIRTAARLPILVGGGITKGKQVSEFALAGANAFVIGKSLEESTDVEKSLIDFCGGRRPK